MFVLKYGLAIIKQKDDNMFHGKGLQRDIIFEVQHLNICWFLSFRFCSSVWALEHQYRIHISTWQCPHCRK